MKQLNRKLLITFGLGLPMLPTSVYAMDGYLVCDPCKYFDPADRQCHDAPGCDPNYMPEGLGYDCGHCGAYFPGGGGHPETIIGCCGATSLSWPQVLCGENQSTVSR